jgi:hypothetical protein
MARISAPTSFRVYDCGAVCHLGRDEHAPQGLGGLDLGDGHAAQVVGDADEPFKLRIVSGAWCSWRGLASMLGRAGTHQLAVAGRLKMGSSLIGAMVSRVM